MDEQESLPRDWFETLARSKAQAERGESVPLEPFMARLQASIERMKRGDEPVKIHRAKRRPA